MEKDFFSFLTPPRVWQTDSSCPVIFFQIWRKSGLLELRFDVEFGDFLRNLEDLEYISSWKFTRNPTFYLLFSRNLGGKSCNSLAWKGSSLGSALQRRNCSLNTQEQPLFWDKFNKNLTIRHLQTATKLDKMSPIIGDTKYRSVTPWAGAEQKEEARSLLGR